MNRQVAGSAAASEQASAQREYLRRSSRAGQHAYTHYRSRTSSALVWIRQCPRALSVTLSRWVAAWVIRPSGFPAQIHRLPFLRGHFVLLCRPFSYWRQVSPRNHWRVNIYAAPLNAPQQPHRNRHASCLRGVIGIDSRRPPGPGSHREAVPQEAGFRGRLRHRTKQDR